jgi:hypothetical protein
MSAKIEYRYITAASLELSHINEVFGGRQLPVRRKLTASRYNLIEWYGQLPPLFPHFRCLYATVVKIKLSNGKHGLGGKFKPRILRHAQFA